MMNAPPKCRRPGGTGRQADYSSIGNPYCTPRYGDQQADRVTMEAGKALAVWLHCIGTRSLRDTQAQFARHPAWRSA